MFWRKDVLADPDARQDRARKLLDEVLDRVPEAIGFLGIGSFWGNGPLDRKRTGKKDMDVILITEAPDGELVRERVDREITKRLRGRELKGLKTDVGLMVRSTDYDDPIFLRTVAGAICVAGRVPGWVSELDTGDNAVGMG